MNHSCWNFSIKNLCPAGGRCGKKMRKKSIVEHFEIPIAALYPRKNVRGMFRSSLEVLPWNSWVSNEPYWTRLVEEQGFPAMKVKMVSKFETTNISKCTTKMDIGFLSSLNYSKSISL
jgi:hypothetical protein